MNALPLSRLTSSVVKCRTSSRQAPASHDITPTKHCVMPVLFHLSSSSFVLGIDRSMRQLYE